MSDDRTLHSFRLRVIECVVLSLAYFASLILIGSVAFTIYDWIDGGHPEPAVIGQIGEYLAASTGLWLSVYAMRCYRQHAAAHERECPLLVKDSAQRET